MNRAELEVAYFGRENLRTIFTKNYISFPYLLLTEAFGVHRNVYRS